MADMMFETEGVLLQLSLFRYGRCKDIMKALVYFVAYNPPSVTKNLFMEDQVSGVNPFNPCAIQDMRRRNWQYVYALINRRITQERPDWIFNNELLLLVSQKSSASVAGSLMAGYNAGDGPANSAAWIIAYWIGKLYSVSSSNNFNNDFLIYAYIIHYFMIYQLCVHRLAFIVPSRWICQNLFDRRIQCLSSGRESNGKPKYHPCHFGMKTCIKERN